MYLNKIKTQKSIVLFKKRYQPKLTYRDRFFTLLQNNKIYRKWHAVYISNSTYVELKFYRFFFLKLRKLSKKKKFFSFVFIYCNHCFSKKSRNARMGKGKGKYLRFVCRKQFLQPLFVFSKISIRRAQKFTNFLNKKFKKNFFLF